MYEAGLSHSYVDELINPGQNRRLTGREARYSGIFISRQNWQTLSTRTVPQTLHASLGVDEGAVPDTGAIGRVQ